MTKLDLLFADLTKTLEQHIANEDDTLSRIEKLLNGNGQPGLVHEHISNSARLNVLTEKITGLELRLEVARVEIETKMEVVRVETIAAKRWALGIGLSALTVLVAIVALLIKRGISL